MSKVVFCNNDITDIKYSGFTITKVYACGGELVYDKGQEPTPCQTSSLPTPFLLNYNAKVYNSSTHTIPMTSGQDNDIDCVLTGDVQNVVAYQDHISLVNTSNVKALVTGAGIFTTHCCLTIVAKAFKPTNSQDTDLLVNRTTSNYNWMFRWSNQKVAFHGSSQINGVAVSPSEPNIISVRAEGEDYGDGTYVQFKNHSTGEYLEVDGFRFGSTGVTSGGTMFAEYANNDANAHFWKGDFYWIYTSERILSEYEIEKVIEYNESCFGVMFAWRKAPVTDYVCDTTTHTKYYKEYYMYSMDSGATWSNVYPTSSRTSEDVIEYNSADCGYIPPFKFKLTLNDSSVVSGNCDASSGIASYDVSNYSATCVSAVIGECTTSIGSSTFSRFRNLTSVEVSNTVTSINSYAFNYCSGMTTCTIGSGLTSIGDNAFYRCAFTELTLPASLTSIGDMAFYDCSHLQSITILATTPPSLVNSRAFTTGNSCPIYVPAESVDTYKNTGIWSNIKNRIQAIP